jgi:hypothetical protein
VKKELTGVSDVLEEAFLCLAGMLRWWDERKWQIVRTSIKRALDESSAIPCGSARTVRCETHGIQVFRFLQRKN